MDTPTHDHVLVHLEYLRQGVDDIRDHLGVLNGRVGKTETTLAVMQDRQDTSKRAAAVWGSGFGAAVAGALTAAWQLFHSGQGVK